VLRRSFEPTWRDADGQPVMSFRVDLLTSETERLNSAGDAGDAAGCIRARLAFNDGPQVFPNEPSLHKRKPLVAILASENGDGSPFGEGVVEVHGVRYRPSLLLESKNKIKILDRLTSEVKRI